MGMGYDVLSMNAINLPRIKWVIRNLSLTDARRMLGAVLTMTEVEEVQKYMHTELVRAGLSRVVPSHREADGTVSSTATTQ